jgi:ABC-type bacteriocin/lantibiotic exporter with double-glycine peptidase domain
LKGKGWVLWVFSIVWILPCASFAGIRSAPPAAPPAYYNIPNVPYFAHKGDRFGPASLASVLAFWGEAVSVDELAGAGGFAGPDDASRFEMEQAARLRGMSALAYRGSLADIRNHIAMGHPVIAQMSLGVVNEFVVVTGYDDQNRRIIAHGVEQPDRGVAYDQFVNGWAQSGFWTLLILPMESQERDASVDNQPN